MSFALTDAQVALFQRTWRFAREALDRDMLLAEERAEFFWEGWRRCASEGILGCVVPERYGGRGYGPLECCVIMQALGRGCPDMGLVFAVGAHLFACTVPIVHFASEAQKKVYLPRLAAGDIVGAHAVTEPDAGSDVGAVATRAQAVPGAYTLTGIKRYVGNAPIASLLLVQATTRPDAGWLGLTAFLLDAPRAGLVLGPAERKIGLRTAPSCALTFDGCEVPETSRLGAEGSGGWIFTDAMNWERTCLIAGWAGLLERQVDEAIAFSKSRRQFGKPIKDFQAVSHRIADMQLRVEAARLLTWRAASMLAGSANPLPSLEAAVAKLYVSEAVVQSSLDLMQILGGAGTLAEHRAERYLRDAVPSRVFSGTSEMMRNTIVRRLGL